MLKNLIKVLTLATASVLMLAATAKAQSSTEIEVRGTVSVPSGEANVSGTTDSGNTIDFERDYDFGNELGFEARVIHRTASKKHKFLGQFSVTDWSRSRTLSRSFTFRGETFLANLATESELKLRVYRGMYSYRWGNEKFRIGPMVDFGVVSVNLDITGTTNNGTRTAEKTFNKFAATIGYDLDYDPSSRINIFSNLGVIAFQGDRLFHTETGIKLLFTDHVGAVGGYKYERYKFVDDPNFIRVSEHGPFFGGVVRF